jgi:hypothetical protein
LIDIHPAIARLKRSPKSMANWTLAIAHSQGGILHSFFCTVQTQELQLGCGVIVGEVTAGSNCPVQLGVQTGAIGAHARAMCTALLRTRPSSPILTRSASKNTSGCGQPVLVPRKSSPRRDASIHASAPPAADDPAPGQTTGQLSAVRLIDGRLI